MTNSGKEKEKIDTVKGLAQAMVQNGLPCSAIAEMFDAISFPESKHKLKDAEKAVQE